MSRVAVVVMLMALGAASASAQEEPVRPASHWEGLDEWATAVTDADGRWRGPRSALPPDTDRPASATEMLRSLTVPVAVHADARVADRAPAALAGLEAAALAMALEGWPAPQGDGGRGGTVGFDLYLRDDESFVDPPSWVPTERAPIARPIRTAIDAMMPLADTDAASSFAELGSGVPDDRVFACAVQAYAEATLLGADVAEAPAVRRALSVWITERITGSFGCDEGRVIDQQRLPERGFITHELDSGEGGALFLGALSERHDRNAGTFLPAVFDGMRQWTRDGGDPHGLPDFWWVIGMALERSGDELLRFVRELSVARYFAGTRRGTSRFRYLARLPDEATIEPYVSSSWARLPRTLSSELEVEPYGSAYASIAVEGAPEGGFLRIWLDGESGVRWSLGAARIDAGGGRAGHTFAPIRDDRRSYLTVELLPGTREVVVVVTNLGARTLDADDVDDNMRGFRLVVDRGL